MSNDDLPGGCLVAVLLVIVAMVAMGVAGNYHVEEHRVTICDKERAGGSGGQYRVYTDRTTYTVEDYFLGPGARSTSADFYGRLKRDTEYDVKAIGWRIGVASMFPNLIEAKEVGPAKRGAC